MHLGHLFFVVHRNLEPEEMNTSKLYYYEENEFITNEEKQQAIQQWPLCRQIVLQRKHVKKDIEIYQENSDGVKGIVLLLTIMITISGSMAVCKQGICKKQTFVHDLQEKHYIMLLSINCPFVDGFDTSPYVMSWMSNSCGTGKRQRTQYQPKQT